ncbi:hypothetical protein EDB80DRAFT_780980 [Ilyonectria destructans]|nr:hypothetical protein EDB80DRAFT_780980 [Ilyonectria destructans]
MSASKDSSVWWRQAIEAAGIFGMLLFVSTTVTIQRDCIMVVSTHAKGFMFLANQGLSWWSLLQHLSDDRNISVLKAAPLRPRLAVVRGWLPGDVRPRPVEGGTDSFPVEEGLASGLVEAQAGAGFPIETAGVPVQDEAAVAVRVAALTADHLWRGGLDGRVFRVVGMVGIVVVGIIRMPEMVRIAVMVWMVVVAWILVGWCWHGRCSSDDRSKGSGRGKRNGLSPNGAQPSKRKQLSPHHLP